jgi:hypothetical protein
MISATCSPASRSAPSRSSRLGGSLAHHPIVGVKAALEVAGERLHGRRVLIDDEEDRLGDWLGHGRTSRRGRTRRPSPGCTMRWQNSCLTSLRRRLLRPATDRLGRDTPTSASLRNTAHRSPTAAARVHSAASPRHHHRRAAPRTPRRSCWVEYTIVGDDLRLPVAAWSCQAAIWYSCVSPPRICFRRIRCSARLIFGGRV